jgi:NADH-quinone oxidoreductase subunit M
MWLWWAFFLSFAVKIPMWPFHTWLPDAHVEAPTAGSVLLAGVLIKAGAYGFLRFSIPFFPQASVFFAPLVMVLSGIAVIYASCIAMAQKDIKKLIAYSSVAHMGFVTMGLFALTFESLQGAVFQMVSHGLISGGLFLCIGMVYERFHTRDIALFGGLVHKMPRYAFVLMVLVLGSVGLPGTMGFVGEFLVLLGTFQVHPFYAILLSTGMLLGAIYALWFYRKIIFGPPSTFSMASLYDLKKREIFILAPLVILVIVLGIYPKPLLRLTEPAVLRVLQAAKSKMGVDAAVCLKNTHACDWQGERGD